ncbi:MAG: hypothetical protein V4594_17855 [Bacteroidota bacterium]
MKKAILIITVTLVSVNLFGQETLQTVTNRGATTTNRISVTSVTQPISRITAYGYNSGYFDIYNNTNNSISLDLIRSDGAPVFKIEGHTMRSFFGGNVGIGVIDPNAKLDISGNMAIQSSLTNISVRPAIASAAQSGELRSYSGTGYLADDGFLRLSAGGGTNGGVRSYVDLSGYSTVPDMNMNIVFGTSGAERMRILSSGNVGIGTANATEKLSVNGKIRAQEIKVETANWPDFVFAKNFQLPSLQETEKHILANGHLPGIPSAAEVAKDGIELGEMNKRLLQKVEELTLHLIRQEKLLDQQLAKSKAQEVRLNKQQKEINNLKKDKKI